MAKHTPGPWEINPRYPEFISTVANDADICEIDGWPLELWAEQKANKHLIAAAPDLLEALEAAYRFISQPQRMDTPAGGPKIATYRTEGYNELTGKLRAAIRKAKGEA